MSNGKNTIKIKSLGDHVVQEINNLTYKDIEEIADEIELEFSEVLSVLSELKRRKQRK